MFFYFELRRDFMEVDIMIQSKPYIDMAFIKPGRGEKDGI